MNILTDPQFWWLGSAGLYERNFQRSTFGRAPSMVSQHTFGWNKQKQCFVLNTDLFLAGMPMDEYPVDVNVAEAFLLRCLDPKFQEVFLSISAAREPAVEIIKTSQGDIRAERGSAIMESLQHVSLPGLSVAFPNKYPGKPVWLHLFNDLRVRFGTRIATSSPDEVRSNLRF